MLKIWLESACSMKLKQTHTQREKVDRQEDTERDTNSILLLKYFLYLFYSLGTRLWSVSCPQRLMWETGGDREKRKSQERNPTPSRWIVEEEHLSTYLSIETTFCSVTERRRERGKRASRCRQKRCFSGWTPLVDDSDYSTSPPEETSAKTLEFILLLTFFFLLLQVNVLLTLTCGFYLDLHWYYLDILLYYSQLAIVLFSEPAVMSRHWHEPPVQVSWDRGSRGVLFF